MTLEARIHIDLGDALAVDPAPTAVWDEPARPWDSPLSRWSGVLPNWTEISCRVRRVRTERGRDGPLELFTPGTATVEVANDDGWATWSPDAPGPLTLGAWMRVRADEWPLFTGLLQRVEDIYAPGARPGARLVIVETSARFGEVDLTPQAPAGAGETVAQRLARICDLVGWIHDLCRFDTGGPQLTAATLEGPALDSAQRAAVTGGGALFADVDGTVVYRDADWLRTDPRATTPQAHVTTTPVPKPPEPPAKPVNLLTNDQMATIESGSTTPALGACWWAGANNTNTVLARTTAHAREGTSALLLRNISATTATGLLAYAATVENATSPTTQRLGIPVVPGGLYTVVASFWLPTVGVAQYQLRVDWMNGAAVVSTSSQTTSPPVRGAWFDARFVYQAPATATHARVAAVSISHAAGAEMYVDRLLFAAGDWPSADWVPPSYVPPVPEPWIYQLCPTGITVAGPDRERVLNVATVAGVDEAAPQGTEPTEVTRRDDTSVATYGPRTWNTGPLYSTDADWLGVLASRTVGLRAQPGPRLDVVEISPVSDPGSYPYVAQARYGDRLQVTYRDPLGWGWDFESHVHGISHDIEPSGDDNRAAAWTVGLVVDDASFWAPGDTWDFARWDTAHWSAPA